MFRHTKHLQFEARPEAPDALFAKKLQELIGGAYGEMTVTMQYLFQGWNCRMEGKYKDLIMDVATEEIGHVEMLATMVARLLEGAPSETVAKAVKDPAVAAVVGGMDPQQAIVSGGGATLADSVGTPWNGKYIVASGNLLADFRANVAAEAQGRLQTARLYNMTDDPGVKEMLKFNLARDTVHQNMWLAAIEELQEDGIEGEIAPTALFDEENQEHANTIWGLSDGTEAAQGRWAHRPAPDGQHELRYLDQPDPLGGPASAPPPDPKLYGSVDGRIGEGSVQGPSKATKPAKGEGMMGKIKDALD
ncbi:manganese catalase family protein [Nocardiopsis algeriensis]|uniref:Mn-containing catalase n=1 Tax=Nocardiopsis algeriensis TaxID=1478215 RepID=A0A841IU95_9ACTN|nr:manganese catalase family protein [Nocardiopsis algeriensis]MBB6121874.1 Mn-containing catalase [Nocardiopsis algeriensis]